MRVRHCIVIVQYHDSIIEKDSLNSSINCILKFRRDSITFDETQSDLVLLVVNKPFSIMSTNSRLFNEESASLKSRRAGIPAASDKVYK